MSSVKKKPNREVDSKATQRTQFSHQTEEVTYREVDSKSDVTTAIRFQDTTQF